MNPSYLAIALLTLTFSDTIIEFRFLTETDAAFQTHATYQQFYSVYSFGTTLIAFIIQGFFASRIIGWLNLKNTFFVLPIAQFVGSIWMLGIPGVVSAVGAIVMQRLSRDTVDESARKAFFSLVPGERRGRVSLFMDSYVPAVGTIVACGVTGLIIFIGRWLGIDANFYIYLAAAALAALVAGWSIYRMQNVYDSSMLNWRLKRRERRASVLDKLNFD